MDSGWSALSLRIPVGLIFMAHGGQKLFSWFGGYELDGTGQWMEAPDYLMALMAGSAEFFGGLFFLIGLLTRVSSLALAVTMIVAILSLHISNGLFMANNGYEFGLSLLVASIALMFSGAGRYSVDALISKRLS